MPSLPNEVGRDITRGLDCLRQLLQQPAASGMTSEQRAQLEACVQALEACRGLSVDVARSERERRENQLLREITLRLGPELTVERLSHLIMDTLVELIPYDAAGLYFLDDRQQTFWETLRGYATDRLHLVKRKLDRGIMRWMLENRKPVIVPDVSQHPLYYNAREQTRSELVVPIMIADRLIGVFNLESDELDNFNEQDLILLTVFANQVANVTEQVLLRADSSRQRHIEKDLRIAGSIQRSLLPGTPLQLPGLHVSGMNISSQEIGGDYYDHFEITDNDIGLVIADVAGKGVPASLIMASFRTGIRLLSQHRTEITDIMGYLNNYLYELTEPETFVTSCYGVYNRKEATFSYVNAGHNPPMHFHAATGKVDLLSEGGLLMGSFPDMPYDMGLLHLDVGDVILFYTDGLDEALSPDEVQFGTEGVRACLSEHGHENPQQLLDAIMDALREHTQQPTRRKRFLDDLTLMVLQRQA